MGIRCSAGREGMCRRVLLVGDRDAWGLSMTRGSKIGGRGIFSFSAGEMRCRAPPGRPARGRLPPHEARLDSRGGCRYLRIDGTYGSGLRFGLATAYARSNAAKQARPLHKFMRGESQVWSKAIVTMISPRMDPHCPSGERKGRAARSSGLRRWRKLMWAARETSQERIIPVKAAPTI